MILLLKYQTYLYPNSFKLKAIINKTFFFFILSYKYLYIKTDENK